MKRLALAFALTVGAASAALGADLPAPAPVPPPLYAPAVTYNWTGFDIGGNLGAAWNGGSFADSIGNTFSLTKPLRSQFRPAGDRFTGNGRNIQLANFGINYKFGGW